MNRARLILGALILAACMLAPVAWVAHVMAPAPAPGAQDWCAHDWQELADQYCND